MAVVHASMLSIMVPMATKAWMSSAAVCLMWWSRREVLLENEQHLRDDREKVPKRGREEGGVDGRSSKQDLYRFHTSCKPTSFSSYCSRCNLLSPLSLGQRAGSYASVLSPLPYHDKTTLPLDPKAKANQPPIKHSPPMGVTGPKNFKSLFKTRA